MFLLLWVHQGKVPGTSQPYRELQLFVVFTPGPLSLGHLYHIILMPFMKERNRDTSGLKFSAQTNKRQDQF